MIVFKVVKPARLKGDVMRLELLNAMRKSGRGIVKDFGRTVKTWREKPKFEFVVSLTGPGPVVLAGTDDKVYGYVNDGTKPHAIFAGVYTGKSDKKALSFASKYTAKTTPRVLDARAGGPSGDKVVVPFVMHPGTEARHFDEEVQKLWQSKFVNEMEAAMRRAAAKSGHAAASA